METETIYLAVETTPTVPIETTPTVPIETDTVVVVYTEDPNDPTINLIQVVVVVKESDN
jgi:hypothetical protein